MPVHISSLPQQMQHGQDLFRDTQLLVLKHQFRLRNARSVRSEPQIDLDHTKVQDQHHRKRQLHNGILGRLGVKQHHTQHKFMPKYPICKP